MSNGCRNKEMERDLVLSECQGGLWTMNETLKVKYSWCCKDICSSIMNFLLEEGQISTIDGMTIASDLGDVGGCNVGSGQCIKHDGITIWKPQSVVKTCKYRRFGIYETEISKHHVVIETIQSALTTVRSTSVWTCQMHTVLSKQTVLNKRSDKVC